GNKIQSHAVIANAWHHRSDVFSSIPVFISLFIATFYKSFEFMDKIGAVIVGAIILKVSIEMIYSAMQRLSDKGVSQDMVKKISDITLSVEDVKDVHAIRTRFLGNNIALDMHILVDKDMSVYKGHEKSKQVKIKIMKEIPKISDIIIHIEPC
ncbi:MAG: cation diffusion facilitator family transporter, partial [Candidatus Muirbacterium halophilum]|nr:cation diffusion facilitator family transporter [Candidatus Muirbacterium halophilum]